MWQSVETGLVRNISHEGHGEKSDKTCGTKCMNTKETVS